MQPKPFQTDHEIASQILSYLDKHPAAKDTLDGIAQWWLLREWSERRLVEVEGAIAFLLSKDLILETRRKGLPAYYQLNQTKLKEISAMLESS